MSPASRRIRPSRRFRGAVAGSPGASATSSPPGSPACSSRWSRARCSSAPGPRPRSSCRSCSWRRTGRSSPGSRSSPGARASGRSRRTSASGSSSGARPGPTTCGGSSPASGCSWRGFRRSCCSRRCTATVARQEVVRIADRSSGLGVPLIFLAVGSAGAGRRGAAVPGGAAPGAAAQDDAGLGRVRLGRGLRSRPLRRPVDRHADRVPRDPVARAGVGLPGDQDRRPRELDHAAHGVQHPERDRPLGRRLRRFSLAARSSRTACRQPLSDRVAGRFACAVHGVRSPISSRSTCGSPSAR